MICLSCQTELPESDFFFSKDCYKCAYKKKIINLNTAPTEKVKLLCRICKRNLPSGRAKYCCDECCYVSKIKKDKERWHYKINVPRGTFKI
jgi:hypothetical protein